VNAETITQKLHARADAKLRAYCDSRFGDLLELCGGHSCARPEVTKELRQRAVNIGVKEPDQLPWHGAVWVHASEVLFLLLRDEWREREVAEFMNAVEGAKAAVDELRSYSEGGAE
jgi:hypothetical protein